MELTRESNGKEKAGAHTIAASVVLYTIPSGCIQLRVVAQSKDVFTFSFNYWVRELESPLELLPSI